MREIGRNKKKCGLTYITDALYQVLYDIEWALHGTRELHVESAPHFDDQQRKKMREIAMKDDDDVQFHWTMASSEMDDEVVLDMIIDQYIKIQPFSFASSIMELYKIENKQCTQKAKKTSPWCGSEINIDHCFLMRGCPVIENTWTIQAVSYMWIDDITSNCLGTKQFLGGNINAPLCKRQRKKWYV